ncbi:unnamed protein product [Brugia timori]|uniref:Uncharacterized protein n=1 Tax=Brugia timori TaxID=42155 RepID=A0A3P7SGN6_9BILA|nr:unnamed protein product [Brugia timori]
MRNIRSGFALGVRALGIATILSVSGVGLFIVSVSAALQVDSPQQFGHKMILECTTSCFDIKQLLSFIITIKCSSVKPPWKSLI